ncbi:MAG: anti-sigma factor [Bacteroidales bacterium]
MRLFTNNNCPNEWIIQAFIDNELAGKQLSEFEKHLANCAECQLRIEKRKNKIAKLFSSLEIIEKNTTNTKQSKSNKKFQYPEVKKTVLIAIAASIIILLSITILTKSIKKQETPIQDNCEWVLMSSQEFFPELESPNKLYRLKVIELQELNEKGEITVNYLMKKCDKKI